jgi:hypothetical protein
MDGRTDVRLGVRKVEREGARGSSKKVCLHLFKPERRR